MTSAARVLVVEHEDECPPAHLVTQPYLTLAPKLPPHVYDMAVQEFAQRSFHESFQVDTLVLLKRSSAYESYKLVNTFTLPPHLLLFE